MADFIQTNRSPLTRVAVVVLCVMGLMALAIVLSPLWTPADYPPLLMKFGIAFAVLVSSGLGIAAIALCDGSRKQQLFWGMVAILLSAGMELQQINIPGLLDVAVAATAALVGTFLGLVIPRRDAWDMSRKQS